MSLWQALLGLLFQQRCGGCGRWGAHALCPACEAAWPALSGPGCPRCAAPIEPGGCRDCRRLSPAFAATYAAGAFTGPARETLHALKYHRRRDLAGPLAARLARSVVLAGDEWLVVPVPLAADRLKARGYNQAALLARALAKARRWRVAEPLRRVHATPPQHALTAGARLGNLAGAFACGPEVAGRRVLLVDDVMTTGATTHWAALALLAAGATEVHVAVVARTLPPGMTLP